ncbi:MAG: response regulator [Desulfuromusa sp.]
MMKKLLLADDSITIQKVVGIIFSTEEYQLEMTDDGDSAFNKALESIPDLVIADISMPGKDGFELCRAIKSEPSLVNTSVLLLPGAFDHFDEIKAGEVCADGWLTKPFESQALLDKVSQLIAAEPVRMAGIAAAEGTAEIPEQDLTGATEADEDLSVNEGVLGLDDVDGAEISAAETDEESPDDIWDAVSFAEEDLQEPGEVTSVKSEDEVSFAAAVIDPSAVDDVAIEPATDEQVLSAFSAGDDDTEAESEEESDFAHGELDSSEAEEFQPESFVSADTAEEDQNTVESDQVESDSDVGSLAPDEEAVDFSVFSDAEDTLQPPEAAEGEEPTYATATDVDEEPLELVNELDAEMVMSSEESGSFVAETEEEPLKLMEDDLAEQAAEVSVAADETVSFAPESADKEVILDLQEEDEPLELMKDDLEGQDTEVEVAEEVVPLVAEPADEEDILDLQEEDEQPEIEPAIQDAAENDMPLAAATSDDLSEEDEVVDLLADEIIDDDIIDEVSEEVSGIGEVQPFVADETALESDAEAEIEPVGAVYDLEDEDVELVEEIETVAAVEEDENFYFDATAADDDIAAITAGTVGVAAGAAAANFGGAAVADSATEKVEQQLRELSEDELKDVVTKVAGPMIEKLASEMLEQIAWEVVPDLAEAMISEEIRKIKEGV